jgi:hypothetical protein
MLLKLSSRVPNLSGVPIAAIWRDVAHDCVVDGLAAIVICGGLLLSAMDSPAGAAAASVAGVWFGRLFAGAVRGAYGANLLSIFERKSPPIPVWKILRELKRQMPVLLAEWQEALSDGTVTPEEADRLGSLVGGLVGRITSEVVKQDCVK